MQDRWYADRLDALKWTVTLQTLSGNRDGVVYVAMRPIAGIEKLSVLPAGWCLPVDRRVSAFLATERKRIEACPAGRRSTRVGQLVTGSGFRHFGFWKRYQWGNRKAYFSRLRKKLDSRPDPQRDVVLVDPDTGITEQRRSYNPHGYADTAEIAKLHGALRPGDALIVFVHGPRFLLMRDREWEAEREQLLADAGVQATSVALDITGRKCMAIVIEC